MKSYKSQQEDLEKRLTEDLMIAACDCKDIEGKLVAYTIPFIFAEQIAKTLFNLGYREI